MSCPVKEALRNFSCDFGLPVISFTLIFAGTLESGEILLLFIIRFNLFSLLLRARPIPVAVLIYPPEPYHSFSMVGYANDFGFYFAVSIFPLAWFFLIPSCSSVIFSGFLNGTLHPDVSDYFISVSTSHNIYFISRLLPMIDFMEWFWSRLS
jgi:hypothetical protein